MLSESDIIELVNRQIAAVQETELAACIRRPLVRPYLLEGRWQYGVLGQTFPCWVVLEDAASGLAVVFSEFGFAPSYPWGIMALADREMGMDCNWHISLEHAVRNTPLWSDRNPPDYEIP